MLLLRAVLIAPHLAHPAIAEPATTLAPWNLQTAAPLRLPGLDGREYDLAAHAGAVVIVHFFATWCEPCRGELKVLRQLGASQNGSVKITILAVNVAEAPARLRSFLKNNPVNFPVLLDRERSAAKAWDVSILPTSFIFDPRLVPRRIAEGDVDWMSKAVRAELAGLAK